LSLAPGTRLGIYEVRTPIDGVFVCSSSTPPGVGVHGMCGYLAAQAALLGGTIAKQKKP
jgi:phytoene dehydrogenase-like protein